MQVLEVRSSLLPAVHADGEDDEGGALNPISGVSGHVPHSSLYRLVSLLSCHKSFTSVFVGVFSSVVICEIMDGADGEEDDKFDGGKDDANKDCSSVLDDVLVPVCLPVNA